MPITRSELLRAAKKAGMTVVELTKLIENMNRLELIANMSVLRRV
jgi:hypothetical protein